MKKNILTRMTALFLVFAFILQGCGKKEEEPQKTKPEAPDKETVQEEPVQEETPEEEEIPPEQMDLIKYNYYVELNNQIVEILDSVFYYYQVVDQAEEFSLLPDTGLTYGYRVYGNNTDTLETCIQLADMDPDYGEMDTLVKEMAEPMAAVMQTFLDIGSCNDFAENQYQKAKEFHAVIYENTDVVTELGTQFIDAVDEMGTAKIEEEEEQMKAEGNLIIYNASRAISIGREVLDAAYDQGVSDENLTDLDLTEIKALYDELVQVVADFDAAASDNDQLVKESLSNSRPFDGLLDSLIQALEWMIKQTESGTLPDLSGSGAPLGSLGHFSEVFGQCIDRYNTVFVD